ncbi:nitroreductase/quinone reductase family protein [Herbidospora daliensis]|uniref:nitroreductase/quinone reductase family protein n=1 Tax=Herbidospora daliensis TaxID=295585 RepID=UPI0007C7F4C4|nr:nitroreductase/quinone reductase family protein [Herbidospora daliensis]
MSTFNDGIVAEFRANGGVVGGMFEGRNLLLLHTVGRRSGEARVNPLAYTSDGNTFLLCGSNSGAPKDPEWVANADAMAEVTLEVGTRTLKAIPRVVTAASPDWERVYNLWMDNQPGLREYESKTTRKFPILALDPIDDPSSW